MSPIDALRDSAQQVGDSKLQQELLGRIGDVRRDLAAQRSEIETMRARLNGSGVRTSNFDYDPPV